MAEISTVTAEFIQEKELPVLDHTMVLKGAMALDGPENIAWHVYEPVRYRMIIRGSQLQQWDEDTGRVQKLDFDRNPAYRAMFQQLTSWFSGQYEKMFEHYEVNIESDDPVVLVFTPRQDTMFEEILSSVKIVFRVDARYIEKLQITELNGSVSTIRFHDIRLDEELEEQMWQVRPQ